MGFARRVLPLVIPHSVAKLIDRRHSRRGNKMIPELLRAEFSPVISSAPKVSVDIGLNFHLQCYRRSIVREETYSR